MSYPPIVDKTKSWLAINPVVGCSLKCGYCFREEWQIGNKPSLKYDVTESVESLTNHPDFSDLIPISVNICSTDPFLPFTKKFTFESLDLLENNKTRNIVGLTTKYGLNKTDIAKLESYEFIRVIVLISLAGIPKHIEPVSVNRRIRTMHRLAQSPIPTVHYFRPIVQGWNDSKDKIRQILSLAQRFCNVIAVGGFRNSPSISKSLSKIGVSTPKAYATNKFSKKSFARIMPKLKTIYERDQLTIPIFIRTKCSVNYLRRYYFGEQIVNVLSDKYCLKHCSAIEIDLCSRI